jgi:Skp family chaperone for outer membrane proteins
MKSILNWQILDCQKRARLLLAVALVGVLFLAAPVFTSVAYADAPDAFAPATKEFVKTVQDARSAFNGVSQDAQAFLDKRAVDIRKAYRSLPDDLERFVTEKNPTVRAQIRRDITEKQQSLKEFSQSFDEWAAKVEQAEDQYQKTIADARNNLKRAIDDTQESYFAQADERVDSLKQSFNSASQVVNDLIADNTRILDGKAAFVRDRYDDEYSLLDKAFDSVSDAVKSLFY